MRFTYDYRGRDAQTSFIRGAQGDVAFSFKTQVVFDDDAPVLDCLSDIGNCFLNSERDNQADEETNFVNSVHIGSEIIFVPKRPKILQIIFNVCKEYF